LKRYAIGGLAALFLALPASSHAAVDVLQGDGGVPVVSFKTAKCKKNLRKGNGLKFIATAKKNGWRLSVNVWTNARDMSLAYGGDGPADFTVTGPGGSWTNLNRPPDAPPGGGAIVFNQKRTRMGIGFAPAFDETFSSSIEMAGGLKCQYPKKKRRRR
jgi:hypothetical protein